MNPDFSYFLLPRGALISTRPATQSLISKYHRDTSHRGALKCTIVKFATLEFNVKRQRRRSLTARPSSQAWDRVAERPTRGSPLALARVSYPSPRPAVRLGAVACTDSRREGRKVAELFKSIVRIKGKKTPSGVGKKERRVT